MIMIWIFFSSQHLYPIRALGKIQKQNSKFNTENNEFQTSGLAASVSTFIKWLKTINERVLYVVGLKT